jgi:nucleotide-binding universal stress UspA family protein
MESMLILTDFSEASFRAAECGCDMAGYLQIKRIILFHAYQFIIATADLPTPPVVDYKEIYLENMGALGLLHDRLTSRVDRSVKFDLVAEDTFLLDGVDELARKGNVGLIVMGVSGKSGLDKLLMGNTTARMVATSKFPLLVVPEQAVIGRPIKTIVFAADLRKDTTSLLPVYEMYAFLDAFKAEICVVNVESPGESKKLPPEKKEAINSLNQLLEKYHPGIYHIEGDDIVKSILDFASQHKASLIMAVPRAHGFLSAIFHKSVTKKLAYNSPIPLLALPDIQKLYEE